MFLEGSNWNCWTDRQREFVPRRRGTKVKCSCNCVGLDPGDWQTNPLFDLSEQDGSDAASSWNQKPKSVRKCRRSFYLKQQRQKHYWDRSAKSLKPLQRGASVTMHQRDGQWKPAVITAAADRPRSYTVRGQEAGGYTRNRRHLLKTGKGREFGQDSPLLYNWHLLNIIWSVSASPRGVIPSSPFSQQPTGLL